MHMTELSANTVPPELEQLFARQAATATVPGGNKPAEFTALIESEMKRWPPLIKELGLRR